MPLQSSLKDRFFLVKVALLKALANLVDGPDGQVANEKQRILCQSGLKLCSDLCKLQLFFRVQSPQISEVAIHLTQHFVWLKRADKLRCSGQVGANLAEKLLISNVRPFQTALGH